MLKDEVALSKEKMKKINLKSTIKSVVDDFNNIYETKRGIKIKFTEQENIDEYIILGIENRMEQVIANLLDNAISFSQSNSKILVEVNEIKKRLKLIKEMGGKDKIKRQYDAGRTTVRERIDALVDKNSFKEIGKLTGLSEYDENGKLKKLTAANSVIGHAKINTVPVVIYGDDFTIRGGASDAAIHEKMITAERFANEYRLPLIRLIEGTGGGGSVKSLEKDGYTYVPANPGWDWVVSNMATVPVISLGLGPVAGLGAARLVSSHYSVIVKNMSQVFVAGPPVVNRLGETVTKESLGGSHIHGKNGVIDDVANSEAEALAMAKKFLSYLPSSTYELPNKINNPDPMMGLSPTRP
jgi:propionyl-CoA carboxylase beta chain